MRQFIWRRLVFIASVFVLIVFTMQLGMAMVDNSERPHPDYDVLRQGRVAWNQTEHSLVRLLQGDLGTIQMKYGPENVHDILKTSYVNSMGLVAAATSRPH